MSEEVKEVVDAEVVEEVKEPSHPKTSLKNNPRSKHCDPKVLKRRTKEKNRRKVNRLKRK